MSAACGVARPGGTVSAGHWVEDRGYHRTLTLLVFFAVLLSIVPDGFNYTRSDDFAGAVERTPGVLSRVQWLPFFAVAGWIVLRRMRLALALLPYLNWAFLLLILLASASVLWSYDPAVTLRRVIKVVGVVMIALAFQLASWTPERFTQALRGALAVCVIASILLVVVAPQNGIHQSTLYELQGAWRGITPHKNTFGQLGCLTALFWLHGGLTRQTTRTAALLGVALGLFATVMSRSSTNLILFLLCAFVLFACLLTPRALRDLRVYLVSALFLVALLYGVLLLMGFPGYTELMTPVADAFGKDVPLSSRTLIWALAWEEFLSRPWLGIGFEAFWLEGPDTPAADLLRALRFDVASTHNGYLEMAVSLGSVGVLLMIGSNLFYGWMIIKVAPIDRGLFAINAALLLLQLIVNMMESFILRPIAAEFFVTTLAMMNLSRRLLEDRLDRYRPRAVDLPSAGG